MNALVEEVARAICCPDGCADGGSCTIFKSESIRARAAIIATLEGLAEDEISDAMASAAYDADKGQDSFDEWRNMFQAMIRARIKEMRG